MKLPAFLSATLCLTTVVVAEPVREIESQILSPAVWEQGAALVDLSIQPRVETYAMGDHQGGGFKEPRDGIIPSRVESIPHYDSSRSDSHAPIGVMGDHTHAAGEVMVGVRYMFMEMDGMRYTDSRINRTQLFAAGSTVEPLNMTMDMTMIDVMYAPSDEVTLFLMPSYIKKSMVHRNAAGVRFRTNADDFGDTAFGALIKVWDIGPERVHFNVGATAPTGHIDLKDSVPGALGYTELPYAMQTGSGTWDLKPGLTYQWQGQGWSWGHQTIGTIRVGRNSHDYSLGDAVEGSQWIAVQAAPTVSFSARLRETWQDRIDGVDDELLLSPVTVPTASNQNQGGFRVDALVGVNAVLGGGHRLAAEFGAPIYQNVNGYQLEVDWLATVAWQLSF